jgi:hypothetical protein
MTSPYRLYNFTAVDSGFNVEWEDHWYNQFDATDMTVSSGPAPMSAAFPLPSFTYKPTTIIGGPPVPSVTIDPFTPGNDSVVSVAAVAPALLGVQVDFTYYLTVEVENGHVIGDDDPQQARLSVAVDLSRRAAKIALQKEILWDYAYTFDGVPTMLPVGSGAPTQLTFPGDYRRPANAQTTRMLTDDELFAVQKLATAVHVAPLSMLGILLELTGARRNAYHPAGNYGISNLTAGQIAAGGLITANGEPDVTAFVNASVHRQLAVTTAYLTGLGSAFQGVLPVFFTLGTGIPQPAATLATQLTVGGVTMTGAQANSRINTWVNEVQAEAGPRMPVSVVPPIGVAG